MSQNLCPTGLFTPLTCAQLYCALPFTKIQSEDVKNSVLNEFVLTKYFGISIEKDDALWEEARQLIITNSDSNNDNSNIP